jgi:tripeptidyl-peptidase-1
VCVAQMANTLKNTFISSQVVIGGVVESLFGTSCAAPVLAGYVTLLNAMRAASGLSTVGWLNPSLYSNSSRNQYNDVTEG